MTTVPLAHIAGLPVEETILPLVSASGAGLLAVLALPARLRRRGLRAATGRSGTRLSPGATPRPGRRS